MLLMVDSHHKKLSTDGDAGIVRIIPRLLRHHFNKMLLPYKVQWEFTCI